jgi:signal transduction histidine kinase/DNA-binding NarL/FixJ family response regulator
VNALWIVCPSSIFSSKLVLLVMTPTSRKQMSGDLVNGLCYTAFLPVYAWMSLKDPAPGAINIVIVFAWTVVWSWYSVLKQDFFASTLACIGMSASIAGMNLYGWPHADEVVVIPQFFWSLLIISGNRPLPFPYKMGLGMVALSTALSVAFFSPLITVADNLPLLLGATAVYLTFHHYANKQNKSNESYNTAHAASLVLAGTFAFHMSSELLNIITKPGYASEGGYSILMAGFFASAGLVASGSFREEIDMNRFLGERLHLVGRALNASETAIAIADSSQNIIYYNAAFRKLTRMKKLEIPNKSLFEVLPVDDVARDCFRSVSSVSSEILVQGHDIGVDISPVLDEKTDHSRFLVVLRDITEKKALARAEKAAEKKVLMAQAVRESMLTLTHELRSPLQGIMGMTSLVLGDPGLSDDTKESLSVVMTSSRLLLTLVNNLLDVRKCDANMMNDFPLSPIRVASALKEAVDFCKPFAHISGVRVQATLDSIKDVSVESNFLRFQQIVINLVSNAIKYTATGSTVSVGARVLTFDQVQTQIQEAVAAGTRQAPSDRDATNESNRVTVISVTDEGEGISKLLANRLFGMFSQLDSSPAIHVGGSSVGQPSGTGLGLNLCLKFVKRMKGNIWFNNNREGGSCFSFYVALASDGEQKRSLPPPRSVGPNESEVEKGLRAQSGSSSASQYRVLVVDDTMINLKVLQRMLKRIGVGKVITVDSGKKALAVLDSGEEFDLVLSDINMPEMNGFQLVDTIRCSGYSEKLVVVGLTADTSEQVTKMCYRSGMSHVLHKPMTSDQMKDFFDKTIGDLRPISQNPPMNENVALEPDEHDETKRLLLPPIINFTAAA